MPTVMFGSAEFRYRVVKSDRKTVGITVDPDRGVLVRAPAGYHGEPLSVVVRRKTPWILRRLSEIERIASRNGSKEFVSGESFLFLGRRLRLKVAGRQGREERGRVSLRGRRLEVFVRGGRGETDPARIRIALREWYREQAARRIPGRVLTHAAKLGVNKPRVIVVGQKRRWGSCGKDGSLRINWRIIMAPTSVLDYVVVHELAHLVEPSHSERFWNFVRGVLPDYEHRREWLRVNGGSLEF